MSRMRSGSSWRSPMTRTLTPRSLREAWLRAENWGRCSSQRSQRSWISLGLLPVRLSVLSAHTVTSRMASKRRHQSTNSLSFLAPSSCPSFTLCSPIECANLLFPSITTATCDGTLRGSISAVSSCATTHCHGRFHPYCTKYSTLRSVPADTHSIFSTTDTHDTIHANATSIAFSANLTTKLSSSMIRKKKKNDLFLSSLWFGCVYFRSCGGWTRVRVDATKKKFEKGWWHLQYTFCATNDLARYHLPTLRETEGKGVESDLFVQFVNSRTISL